MAKRAYVVALLGSGASVPLGVPTMTSMVQEFEQTVHFDELRALHTQSKREHTTLSDTTWHQRRLIERQFGENHEKRYCIWYRLLNRRAKQDSLDIEWILSRLPNYRLLFPSDLLEFPELIYLYTGDIYHSFPTEEQVTAFWRKIEEHTRELRTLLVKFLVRRCTVKGPAEVLRQTYGPVLDGLRTLSYDVYTTNYDTLVEQYFVSTGINIERGIDERRVFDPSRLRNSPNHPKVVKLHGAVDLFTSTDGIRHEPEWAPSDNIQAEARLIYPNLSEPSAGKAFSFMLEQLRTSLNEASACFIIGHSLRDRCIAELLSARSEQRSAFLVCVIDPRADDVVKRLPSRLRSSAIVIDRQLEELGPSDLMVATRRVSECT